LTAHSGEQQAPATTPSNEESIVMYSTTWCGDCRRAKRVFGARGVEYTEVNIDDDRAAAREVMRLNGGMRSVPTILFPDGSVLVEPSMSALENKLSALAK
jgi:mycoredoxin